MKTFFVVNPKSANGNTGKRWGELVGTIARALPEFGVEFTKAPMDAVALTSRALDAGYECVVAVGGDGTINEVTNGFFRDGKVINPQAALGVLPRGTGGDFRRTFEWDLDFETAVQRLKTPDTRPFDIGLAEYQSHGGQRERRYFANIFSFGVSGEVIETVNAGSKALGGKLSFMWGSLKALTKYKDQVVKLTIDGQPPLVTPITTVAVANGRFFGGGMKVAPDADVSDGIFNITIWSGYGLSDFVFKSAGVYSGAHIGWKGTTALKGREVVVELVDPKARVLVDCDGEQPGTLPCTVKLLPGAIRLKV